MPARDVVKVSWDKGEPMIMSYKPTGWRSIVPMRPGMKDNLQARWPALEDAKTFFERLQSAQTVEITFPDGNKDSYRVGGLGVAWSKTCQ